MLRFIVLELAAACANTSGFNTSNVKVHLISIYCYKKAGGGFNTSNVKVHPQTYKLAILSFMGFNTSNVKVHLEHIHCYYLQMELFQYIQC